MGRLASASEQAVLNSRTFKTHYELSTGGVTLGYLAGDPAYDPFVSGSIQIEVNQPVQSATFNCHLGKGSKSLSPFLSTGMKNELGTGPALYPGSPISFRTSCVAPGTDPATAWRYVFQGRVDSIDLDPAQDLLTIKCRDLFAEIQDRWISTLSNTDQGYIYGFPIDAARVDVAMQQVITKAGGGPSIAVQGTPNLAVSAFWQEQMGLLEALRRLGMSSDGWDLRGLWDVTAQDVYDLTYYDPDRLKNASNVTLVGNGAIESIPRYYSLKLSTSIANVRNVGDVIPANDLRVPQRVTDPASIALFGARFAGLSEDRSSHIDTDAEALALAAIMVNDLSSPPVDVAMEMPYYWIWQINDLFRIDGDGFAYDSNNIYAVSSITHNFSDTGEPTTTVTGSLAARAAVREWGYGRKRLNQVRLGEPAGPGMEGDVWFQTDDLTLPTVL